MTVVSKQIHGVNKYIVCVRFLRKIVQKTREVKLLESSLSITDAYCTVHCVDRDGKGKGFRPGSSFLFRRHFQIMASVCSLIKSLFEMASLSRCLKVHNRVKRVKMTPFKYFLLLIDRNGGI